MRKLADIIKEIRTTEELINKPLELVPYAGRPGLEMAQNKAKLEIKGLYKEYADAVFAKSVVYFPVGNNQELFAQLANKVAKTLTFNGDALYEYLTDRVEPALGHHRNISVNQMMAVHRSLRNISMELGFDLPADKYPELKGLPVLSDHSSVVQYLKHLVIDSSGYLVTNAYMRNLIFKEALGNSFSGNVLTVTILNTIGTDQSNLAPLFTKSVVVDTNKELTEESVAKIIKESFKK